MNLLAYYSWPSLSNRPSKKVIRLPLFIYMSEFAKDKDLNVKFKLKHRVLSALLQRVNRQDL